MPADDEIKTARREGKLLSVGLLEPGRDTSLGRLAQSLAEHCGGEVNAGDTMTASRELEGEESCTAAGVEHVERAPLRQDDVEYTLPGGTFGGSPDGVAEVLIEVRRASIPMGRDLSLDDVNGLPAIRGLPRTHSMM
jgi:hypothetical protein